MENADDDAGETVLLEEAGQRISFIQAYPHRGQLLKGLSLYDYMSIVKLKRKGKGAAAWGELQFDSAWPLAQMWVQALRKPGKNAVVYLDGYLSMDFREEEEQPYYRRAAVQHLALFVPWETFLSGTSGDINTIWEGQKQALPPRVAFLADNIQLLRRSVEDAKRDARQWAAMSGGTGSRTDAVESGIAEDDERSGVVHRSDNIKSAVRLIDVLRNAMRTSQVTAGSEEILSVVQQLCQLQLASLCSTDELGTTMGLEPGPRAFSLSLMPR